MIFDFSTKNKVDDLARKAAKLVSDYVKYKGLSKF